MSARRLDIVAVLLVSIFGASTAEAQLSGGQWRLSPNTGTTRRAVEVRQEPTVFYQPGVNPYLLSQPVAVTFVPAVLMSDGRVFANFGYGFEPIVRSCYGGGGQRVVASNGAVLYHSQAPTYTQPVPNQQTQSQQMVSSGQTQTTMYSTNSGALACFSRDAAGRVFAYRY
jgi:hypothetical protein